MAQKLNGNLDRALGKLRPYSDTKEWCASLTPSEIMALIKDGYKLTDSSSYRLQHLKEEISKGFCSPSWIYFQKVGNHAPKFIKHSKHDKNC